MSKELFLNEMNKVNNMTLSTNGAIMYSSSLNSLLDFFGQATAMRYMDSDDVIELFEKAFEEDNLMAIKCVFYIGDILGGQGERRTFRILLKYIAINHTKALSNNLRFIPELNRWDSIYELFDTPLEDKAIEMLKEQLLMDIKLDTPSLAAKWCKSCNASSNETKRLGRKTARLLNLGNFIDPNTFETKKKNEFIYRKVLTTLRDKINVVEVFMSSNNWDDINYNHVPSKAMANYKNAFKKNDSGRFSDYVDKLATGDSKINTKALYPYEIVKKIIRNYNPISDFDGNILEAQWNSLPDYIEGSDMKGLCVVDVSGSMAGTPLEVAVATGLYVAERCSGVYHNKFITFSERPEIVDVKGLTIVDKVRNVLDSDWGYNTNLESVFNLILDTAIRNNAPQSDIPEYLIILTDMGWDNLERGYEHKKYSFIETIKAKFEDNGYKMPVLVLWNINSEIFPMSCDENGWISVSGYSPSVFKALLSKELLGADNLATDKINPVEAMMVILNNERYKDITI